MTTIQERLAESAARTQRQVVDVDTDAALAAVSSGVDAPVAPSPRRSRTPLLIAAALVLAVVAAAVVFVAQDDDTQVVADGPSTTGSGPSTTAPTGPPTIDVTSLGTLSGIAEAGTVSFAGTEDAFATQWVAYEAGPAPSIDFEEQVVLAVTVDTPVGCLPKVQHLVVLGTQLSPDYEMPGGGCPTSSTGPATVVLAVDRSELPTRFRLVTPISTVGLPGEASLDVDLSQDSASVSPTTSAPDQPPDGPDLQTPAGAGHVITFDGVGDVRLGDRLAPSAVQSFEGTACGYWGPIEPSHDGDEPLRGLAAAAANTGSPAVVDIRIRDNPRYRTASGVGIGTTLASLQRIYGSDLVVDLADGWDHPTDGLLAMYQDVAAVRNGEHALTFLLRGGAVEQVKVGDAEFWGDDEGCA